MPLRIGCLDQLNLPRPSPFLHGLLPRDGIGHAVKLIKPDQPIDAVTRRETVGFCLHPMLPFPLREVGRHANVKRPVKAGRQNINARSAHSIPLLPSSFPRKREPILIRKKKGAGWILAFARMTVKRKHQPLLPRHSRERGNPSQSLTSTLI